jgi:hypothetical protein
MDQDVDISPNATPSEIGEELVFQSALLESLDPEAFNYQEEKDKIERMMEALQTRLEAISPPTPNNFEDGMDMLPDFTIGFDGYYDGEGNDDGEWIRLSQLHVDLVS